MYADDGFGCVLKGGKSACMWAEGKEKFMPRKK